jgi:hypothetical protein
MKKQFENTVKNIRRNIDSINRDGDKQLKTYGEQGSVMSFRLTLK